MPPKLAFKRPLLFLLSLVVGVFVVASLVQSFNQPQVQDRLAIAQTYLTLQASEFEVPGQESDFLAQQLLGKDPYAAALKQYEPLLQSTEASLDSIASQLQTLDTRTNTANPTNPAQATLIGQQQKQRQLLQELQLEAGILNAIEGNAPNAQTIWQSIQTDNPNSNAAATAAVLSGNWSDPARLLPDAELILKRNLRGWFRDESLERLYTLEQRQAGLDELAQVRQERAEATLGKLAFVVLLPIFSAIAGSGIILTLLIQTWRRRRQGQSNPLTVERWEVPWDASWLAIGLLGGFFFIGQIVISAGLGGIVFAVVNAALETIASPIRSQAIGVFCIYNLMAAGVLGFLYLCLRSFGPLPKDWFRFNLTGRWFLWGLGGYFAAYPLVLLVSLLNQQIWDGQGGSNPLLTLALENQDNVALIFFFVTAAIAAPIFEEIFFRGFLMASLTRFMPGWGAVLLSAFIFAAAHLSLSEILPLMTLGSVLGFVYGRSRNLLASMLLHGLWNSGTLVSLLLLGSALRS